ncbi:MAG TPA: DUF308 domain-containing protein [bacterium]|nr:DUF308 domain-containing protein [bacterium]
MNALARNWWAVVLRGVLAIAFGLIAFFYPTLTLPLLVLLFGAYALVDGVFAFLAAMRAAARHERWGAFILEGISGVAAGILTFVWPAMTALVLLYLIAAWAVITGIFEIVAAIRLRKEIAGEWMLGLGGLASIVLGVLLVVYPSSGALVVIWIIGLYAILFGVLLLGLGLRLRGMAGAAAVQKAL